MIKVQLNSGKNIDDVYHFTKTFESFISICDSLKIYPGSKIEAGPAHKISDFVCLTRDKHLMQHNGSKYVAGFILDGDILTDIHKTEPMSYVGYNLGNSSNAIRIRTLTSYDDGTYTMYMQPFGSLKISEKAYNILANILENLPNDIKQLKNLTVSTGKRKVQGHKIVQKYTINTQYGVNLSVKQYPELTEIVRELATKESTNEYEERVWNRPIDIKHSLKGIILRKTYIADNATLIKLGLDNLVNRGFDVAASNTEIGYEDSNSFRIIMM